jgi:hypothetical protein
MKRMAILVACAVIAACSDGDVDTAGADKDGDGSVSMREAARAAAGSNVLKPEAGQYRATITMTGIDVPGMPPEMAGHGAGMTTTTEYCLTPEDVRKGFREMVKQGQDGECNYERFNLTGGRMDAVMVCQTDQGTARMEMAGTTSATSSEYQATMAMNMPEMGGGTMSFTGKHERIGDCPAK